MTRLLESIIYEIPWLALAAWMVFLAYYTEKSHAKILATKNRFDPEGEFIKSVGGMQFSRNRFRVNRKHHLCTEEFLQEWDKVYGVYWRRAIAALMMLPAVILLGRLVRYWLQSVVSYFS